MAYQNFFASATNGHRKSPAQTSGKEMIGEFRMRNTGDSVQVVSFKGYDNEDGTITAHVVITSPETGEVLLDRTFTCPK